MIDFSSANRLILEVDVCFQVNLPLSKWSYKWCSDW